MIEKAYTRSFFRPFYREFLQLFGSLFPVSGSLLGISVVCLEFFMIKNDSLTHLGLWYEPFLRLLYWGSFSLSQAKFRPTKFNPEIYLSPYHDRLAWFEIEKILSLGQIVLS